MFWWRNILQKGNGSTSVYDAGLAVCSDQVSPRQHAAPALGGHYESGATALHTSLNAVGVSLKCQVRSPSVSFSFTNWTLLTVSQPSTFIQYGNSYKVQIFWNYRNMALKNKKIIEHVLDRMAFFEGGGGGSAVLTQFSPVSALQPPPPASVTRASDGCLRLYVG